MQSYFRKEALRHSERSLQGEIRMDVSGFLAVGSGVVVATLAALVLYATFTPIDTTEVIRAELLPLMECPSQVQERRLYPETSACLIPSGRTGLSAPEGTDVLIYTGGDPKRGESPVGGHITIRTRSAMYVELAASGPAARGRPLTLSASRPARVTVRYPVRTSLATWTLKNSR